MPSPSLNEEMVATYGVTITGVERTEKELARIDKAISLLRTTAYMTTSTGGAKSATRAAQVKGQTDLFVSRLRPLEGRIQTAVSRALAAGMALGKRTQASILEAAVTQTGLAGGGKRKGPGRNKTGGMIRAIITNVETAKIGNLTVMTGFHGWARSGRSAYFEFQERGTKGRGQTSRALTTKKGSVARKVNQPYGKDFAGKKRSRGAGVPAANSLGGAIVPVREFLRRELNAMKR